MKEKIDVVTGVTPSAAPSEADLAAWQALPRHEQLRRLRLKLMHPDCAAVSTLTMSDIHARAEAAAKFRHG